jgi:hypothetical protein
LRITYKPHAVAELVTLTVTGTDNDGNALPSASASISVRELGLIPLGLSGIGFSVESSVGHGVNNAYGTPTLIDRLESLPGAFKDAVIKDLGSITVPTLVYTSLSLPMGGVFDVDASGDGVIDNAWEPPHCTHRQGREVDLRIRSIPRELRGALKAAIRIGFEFPVPAESPTKPAASHWHLRLK